MTKRRKQQKPTDTQRLTWLLQNYTVDKFPAGFIKNRRDIDKAMRASGKGK